MKSSVTRLHGKRISAVREIAIEFLASLPWLAGVIAWAMQNWHALFWGLWIAAFLLVELPAVFNARLGDTFSETWWRWLRIRGHEKIYKSDGSVITLAPFPLWVSIPLRIAIVAFGIWLIGHLGFGLWGGEQ